MSIKTIAKKAGNWIITTKNGAKTTTGSIYTRQLKEYIPLENGFNKELADDVLDIISANEALWNQGEWRRLFDLDDQDDYVDSQYVPLSQIQDQVEAMIAFDQDKKAPTCGTAMCFAGWVGELTGVDWVVDSTAIRAYAKGKFEKHQLDYHISDVLIPTKDVLNEGQQAYYAANSWEEIYNMTPGLADLLRKRGFTTATHKIGSIDEYASVQLGSIQGSPLFSEGNSIENITKIVNTHVEFGPSWYLNHSNIEDDDYEDDDEG